MDCKLETNDHRGQDGNEGFFLRFIRRWCLKTYTKSGQRMGAGRQKVLRV